ncbi:hypothetical protein, partial [Bilophila wadsworthia]|uniref:hypothetical protein n=1 Tax=Bilophila wadsworthia TaxID=35833 RepID=UPI003AB5322B
GTCAAPPPQLVLGGDGLLDLDDHFGTVNEASGFGTGQLPDKEGQMYHATADNFYMIPTAEREPFSRKVPSPPSNLSINTN